MKTAGNDSTYMGYTGCQFSSDGNKIWKHVWSSPEYERANLARGRSVRHGTLDFDGDADPWGEVYLIPDDPKMSCYDRRLVKHGHQPGVLDGRDVPKGKEPRHVKKRQALIRKMEQLYEIRTHPWGDTPKSPTWIRLGGPVPFNTPIPVRVVIADRETAAKAADQLYFRMLELYRVHEDWVEALQYAEAICMHFDVGTTSEEGRKMKAEGNDFAAMSSIGWQGRIEATKEIAWLSPEFARANLARGRTVKRGTFAFDEDTDPWREAYLIPDDPKMSCYDRHLVQHGHQPGVLDGRDVPKGKERRHAKKRQALIRKMEQLYEIQTRPWGDTPKSLTWIRLAGLAPWHTPTPVRVVIADRETAAKAADHLYFGMLQLYRVHEEWIDALQYAEVICMHFDVEMKRKWPKLQPNHTVLR